MFYVVNHEGLLRENKLEQLNPGLGQTVLILCQLNMLKHFLFYFCIQSVVLQIVDKFL